MYSTRCDYVQILYKAPVSTGTVAGSDKSQPFEHRYNRPMNRASPQAASAVLMVRPARFAWNPQTEASNRFQRSDATLAQDAASLARVEFDGLVARLQAAGVVVHAVARSRRARLSRRRISEQLGELPRRRHAGRLSVAGAESATRTTRRAGDRPRRPWLSRDTCARPHTSRNVGPVSRGHRQRRVRPLFAHGVCFPLAAHGSRRARRVVQ